MPVRCVLASAALVASACLSILAHQPQPSVTFTNTPDMATGVPRDVFVAADVFVPNGGIDPATLTPQTVWLERISDGVKMAAVLNTSGGGDVIVLRPAALLDANTMFTFVVTSGLKDITGSPFFPYSMRFTTGTTSAGTDTSVVFEKVSLSAAPAKTYTSVTLGPDGKLYAGAINGEILRFDINADGTLAAPESITSLQMANGGAPFLIGLTFDPSATATDLVAWVTHTHFAFSNAPDWTGRITRLSGPSLEQVTDYVVGLPRSSRDHVTNQLTFGPDGALYFMQGSNSAMGAPDSAWNLRPERLLTAAVLRLDIAAIATVPLDVRTDEGGTYDPFAPGAPLTIFASGTRNAFDLLWHRNGWLYVPTNGSASGGSTPATPTPFHPPYLPRMDSAVNSPYAGPEVPARANIAQTMNDYLFKVVSGGYYGHPNPARHEYVLNGGNPTAGTDTAEVTAYPAGTQPDRNWRRAAFDFGQHYSPDGIIEYKSAAFAGALVGKLLVARYSGGDDIIVLTPGVNGDITQAQTGIAGMTGFVDPLDLVENPANGYLYVAEYGGQKLTLLRPVEKPAAPSSLTATTASSSRIDLAWTDTASNEGGFRIERADAGGSFAEISTGAANVTSFASTGLLPSTTYSFRVRAFNAGGTSEYSNVATATTQAAPPPATGDGLRGQYFDAINLSALKLARIDPTVNFNFGSGSPDSTIAPDTFSARWSGQVKPRFSQTYTFYTTSDDGVRLWVNGQRLIDNWTNHAPKEDKGTIALVANQNYDLVMEYFENTGGAVAQVSWSSASQAKQIIPQSQLYSVVPIPSAPSGLSPTVVSSSQINLSWTDSSKNEDGFRIERSLAGVNFQEIGTVGVNVTTFNSTGLAAATTYTFRVRAYNGAGQSGYSNNAGATTSGGAAPTIYQAEAAAIVGATVASTNAGYTGSGYVDYLNPSGDYIEWTVNVGSAGTYTLEFRYTNGASASRPLELRVNGVVAVSSLAFAPTGGWTTWKLVTTSRPLVAGANKIRLTAIGSSGGNFDSLTVR